MSDAAENVRDANEFEDQQHNKDRADQAEDTAPGRQFVQARIELGQFRRRQRGYPRPGVLRIDTERRQLRLHVSPRQSPQVSS